MEYNRIIMEMFDRIQVLEERVGNLENNFKASVAPQTTETSKKVSIKYCNLAKYLVALNTNEITLSYADIEKILGFRLPQTAHKHINSFWANTYTHSFATSWLSVGYKTKVDADKKYVTFVKNLV